MKLRTGIVLLSASLLTAVHAAEISWTTSLITGDANDVVNTGTTIEAINGAHTGEAATPTINGVIFTSDGSLLGGNWNGDPWTNTVADADYDKLLSTLDYEGSGVLPYTIKTFNGLTVGAEYLIQVWHADHAAVGVPRTMIYEGSGDNIIDGISYGVGTFTADAATQDFIVSATQNGPRLTAYQLRAISGHVEPDPAIELSVTELDIGGTYVGYTNSGTVTVKNIGGKVLEGTASISAPFSIESGATYSLSNNQSQVVTVLFGAQSIGEVSETLTFTGGGGTSILVSGTGEAEPVPAIGLSVSNLTFSTTYLGTSNTLNVIVRNDGGGLLEGTASVAAPFAVVFGATYALGLGEEQSITVSFTPEAVGDVSELLSFTGGGGTTIPCSGIGAVKSATLVADIALDYTGPSAEPEGWDYLYSDAAIGGTEVSLTPDSAVASSYGSGNVGFGHPAGQYGVAAVLGSVTGTDQYEIFSDGYDGKNSDQLWGHYAVPGIDILIHPGSGTDNAFVILRYTFSEADLAAAVSINVSGSFRDLCGKTADAPADSVLTEIYHNTASLFSATGSVGRLTQVDGTFELSNLMVEVGDTISFVVGNNGVLNGDETALTGSITLNQETTPDFVPGEVYVEGGLIYFQFTGAIGDHYQVESSDNLPYPDWQMALDIDPLLTSPMEVSLPTTDEILFYRIKHIP